MVSDVKVFISWSGDNSRYVAEALRVWLPTVLAGAVECFVSSKDIRRGERGMDVIASELEDRDYGIVVLTRDNMQSPWINFEAGALGKTLGAGKVAPLLLDLTRADVIGPIAQFQSTLLRDRQDVRQFIGDLAQLTPNIPEESIDALFDSKWPELESVVDQVSGMDSPQTTRSAESMLEEVLERVRRIERQAAEAANEDRDRLGPNVVEAALVAVTQPPGAPSPRVFRSANRHGPSLRLDTGSTEAEFDSDLLQAIADAYDTQIFLIPQGATFTPAVRARRRRDDPLV